MTNEGEYKMIGMGSSLSLFSKAATELETDYNNKRAKFINYKKEYLHSKLNNSEKSKIKYNMEKLKYDMETTKQKMSELLSSISKNTKQTSSQLIINTNFLKSFKQSGGSYNILKYNDNEQATTSKDIILKNDDDTDSDSDSQTDSDSDSDSESHSDSESESESNSENTSESSYKRYKSKLN